MNTTSTRKINIDNRAKKLSTIPNPNTALT